MLSRNITCFLPLYNKQIENISKEKYDWTTYKYCKGTEITLIKYCGNSSYGNNGFTDGKTILDPEDDAAAVNWGGAWRMPTEAEQDELRDNCTWTWTTQNGKNGYRVTGRNGKSIFLPIAGFMSGNSCIGEGETVGYWTNELASSDDISLGESIWLGASISLSKFNNIKNNYLKVPDNIKNGIEDFFKKFNYWGKLDYKNNLQEQESEVSYSKPRSSAFNADEQPEACYRQGRKADIRLPLNRRNRRSPRLLFRQGGYRSE